MIVESAHRVRVLLFLTLEYGRSMSFQVLEVVQSARSVRFLCFLLSSLVGV